MGDICITFAHTASMRYRHAFSWTQANKHTGTNEQTDQSGCDEAAVNSVSRHRKPPIRAKSLQRRTNSQTSFGSSISRFVQQCLVRSPLMDATTPSTSQQPIGFVERFIAAQMVQSSSTNGDVVPTFGDKIDA